MNTIDEKWIRDEIKKQLHIILASSAGSNDSTTETINDLFPGMPGIPSRPVMHPYGFVSRAKQGIIGVIAKVGDHVGNVMTLGHRDSARPTDISEGEAAVYSMNGYTVRVLNGKVQVGKGSTYETVVVGETLATLLGLLIDHIVAHTHFCSVPGSPGTAPINSADFLSDKANYVSNNKILAKDGGRF